MELQEFRIKNFRSIKDETIEFKHNCLILLGKNEAGKTNILKAIASVLGEYIVSTEDRRKRIDNEKITEYYVYAIFKLDNNDFNTVANQFNLKFKGHENIIFKNKETLNNFIQKHFYSFLICLNIENNEVPNFKHWSIKNEFELEKKLFKTTNNTITENQTNTEFNLSLEIFNIIKELYNKNPLKCHYWKYSKDYLLPNKVVIQSFISNPSSQKALENIFLLCGRNNIKNEFNDALTEDGDYLNLLEQISKKVTSTFQKIWKDFKGTSIQLLPNGNEILIKVADKAKYNFEDRSDGFKKFISILLMLSTQSRANQYKNDIILIDEPDQSLYPTSAQHLRDELIEISKFAKIIYSTHSQYMIDSSNIDRHLVVEKKDDITTIIKEHKNAEFSTDELLKRAIGTSIFECLQPINIIFEGYLDKQLFELHLKFHKIENDFKQYGKVYLSGISGAEMLIQILILANKKFVIVADSDETSKNKKIDFIKNYPEYKDNWISYADVVSVASTMEDFMTTDYLQEQITNLGHQYSYNSNKNAIYNIEKATCNNKEKKQEIKNTLIKNLDKSNITKEYTVYITSLQNKLKSL